MRERRRGVGRGGLAAGVVAVVFAVALLLAMEALLERATERALRDYAARAADTWAQYLETELLDLPEVVASGRPDSRQRVVIYFAASLGDVERFRIYRDDGRLALTSDLGPVIDGPSLSAALPDRWREVLDGGVRVVLDGGRGLAPREEDERAEVYLPLRDVDGQVYAAAEVSLALGRSRAAIGDVLRHAGAGVALLMALGFGAAFLAFRAYRRRAEEAESRARRLAEEDPLTGLANRRAFLDAAERAIEAGEGRIVVALLDVDRFRAANEAHGRAVGDALLTHVARALRAACGPGDAVARLGADEFAVRLRLPDGETTEPMLLRLCAGVARPIQTQGRAVGCTASLGAHLLAPGETLDAAVAKAEIALAEARSAGEGALRVFEPEMEARVRRRRHVERAVREGIAADLFTLAYQPLVERESRATHGFEALMRLTDGTGASIPPSEFIPVAEDLHLITRLGAWALRHACGVAAGWPDPLKVSVNLSVQQFRDGRLPATVAAALRDTGLAPERLELEITESLLIADPEEVSRQLEELKAMGVAVAMDDFGTGYSSLSHLWRFGFDRLKLDRGFVLALEQDAARARDVIAAIVALGHRLGMAVTAEGIETERQAGALGALGCDHLQGFRFGVPLNERELREVMNWTVDAVEDAAPAPFEASAEARSDEDADADDRTAAGRAAS